MSDQVWSRSGPRQIKVKLRSGQVKFSSRSCQSQVKSRSGHVRYDQGHVNPGQVMLKSGYVRSGSFRSGSPMSCQGLVR